MANVAGSALCARCGAPLPLGGAAAGPQPGPPMPGYPPAGYPPAGYPPYGYYPPMYVQQRTSGFAIAGFVCSLVVCGLLGLIFSIMGNNEVKRSDGTVTGGGLATAGIIISAIRLVLEVIYIIWIISLIGDASSHSGRY
jgi:hypothetical protein